MTYKLNNECKQKKYSAFCNSFYYRAVDIDTGRIKDARKKKWLISM